MLFSRSPFIRSRHLRPSLCCHVSFLPKLMHCYDKCIFDLPIITVTKKILRARYYLHEIIYETIFSDFFRFFPIFFEISGTNRFDAGLTLCKRNTCPLFSLSGNSIRFPPRLDRAPRRYSPYRRGFLFPEQSNCCCGYFMP